MHAETLPRTGYQQEGLGRPFAYAVGLHLLLALFLWLSSWITWDHDATAAGGHSIEATMQTSAAEDRAIARALNAEPVPPPEPAPEPVEEETVPPPQPIPEPRPQDSPVEQQRLAQERIPVPDTIDQDEANRLAISQEKALREQEQKRRQEQIDLTEQKRVEQAQKQQRLAQQQEEADKQKKLAEIRRQRAQLDQQQKLAEQKLRQIADARARQASASASSSTSTASAPAGSSGADPNLSGQYAAAIQKAVLNQWVRPDSIPQGQRCRLTIRQLPGGEVVDVEFSASCPYDEAGKRSVEAAVLRAQPLPYRGFESVFQRTLNFNFEAQDR